MKLHKIIEAPNLLAWMWYKVVCSGWKAAQNNNATEPRTCMPKARWHLRARDCPAMGSELVL
jgi:hypothetical protein